MHQTVGTAAKPATAHTHVCCAAKGCVGLERHWGLTLQCWAPVENAVTIQTLQRWKLEVCQNTGGSSKQSSYTGVQGLTVQTCGYTYMFTRFCIDTDLVPNHEGTRSASLAGPGK